MAYRGSGAVGGNCPFVPPPLVSTCRQRYSLHKMAAVNPQALGDGVFQASFRVPSGCFCHVSQQTAPPDILGLKVAPPGDSHHSQQPTTVPPAIATTPALRFTRTQNSGADSFATLDDDLIQQVSFGQHDHQHQTWQEQEEHDWQDSHQPKHQNQQLHISHHPEKHQQQQHQSLQTQQHQPQQHQEHHQHHQFQEHSHQQQHQPQQRQQQPQQLQQPEPHHQHQQQQLLQQQHQQQQQQQHQQQQRLQQQHQQQQHQQQQKLQQQHHQQQQVQPHHQQQEQHQHHQQESDFKGTVHIRQPTGGPNDWRPVTLDPTFREAPETSPHPLVSSYLQVTNITFSHHPSGVLDFEVTPPTAGTSLPKVVFQGDSPITTPTSPPTTSPLQLVTSATTQTSKLLGSSTVRFNGDDSEFLNVEFSPTTFTSGSVTDSQGIIGELNQLGVKAVGDKVEVSETGDNNFILTLQQVRQDGTQVPLELLISVDGRLISAASTLSSSGSTQTAQNRRGLEDTQIDLQALPSTVKRYVEEIQGKTSLNGGSRARDDITSPRNSSGILVHLGLDNDTSKTLILNAKPAPNTEQEKYETPPFIKASDKVEPLNGYSPRSATSPLPKKFPFPRPARMTEAPRQWLSSPLTGPPHSSSSVTMHSKFSTVKTSPQNSSNHLAVFHRDDFLPSLNSPHPRPAATTFLQGSKSGWDIPQSSQTKTNSHTEPGTYRRPSDWWIRSQLFPDRPHVIQNYFIQFQDSQRKEAAASGSEAASTLTALNGQSLTSQNLEVRRRENLSHNAEHRPAGSSNYHRKAGASGDQLSAHVANSTSRVFGYQSQPRVRSSSSIRNRSVYPKFTFPPKAVDQTNARKAKGKTAPVFSILRQRKKISSRTIRDVGFLAGNGKRADTKVKIRLKFANSPSEPEYILTKDGRPVGVARPLQLSNSGQSIYNDPTRSIKTPSRKSLQSTLSLVTPVQTARRGVLAFSRGHRHTPPYVATNPSSLVKEGTQLWLADTMDRSSFSPMDTSSSRLLPQWRPSFGSSQEFALLAHPSTAAQAPFPLSSDVTFPRQPVMATATFGQDVFLTPLHSQIQFLGNQAQHRAVLAPVTRRSSSGREFVVTPLLPPDVLVAQRKRLWGKRKR